MHRMIASIKSTKGGDTYERSRVQIDWLPDANQSNGGDKSTLDYQKPFAIRIPDLSVLNSSLGTHFMPGYLIASFK